MEAQIAAVQRWNPQSNEATPAGRAYTQRRLRGPHWNAVQGQGCTGRRVATPWTLEHTGNAPSSSKRPSDLLTVVLTQE